MPKASILQSSFSSGEVSPLFYGQADNPRYKKGLKTALNVIPTLQGPLLTRPGTKYAAQAKVTGSAPILIPFQFSENQAYMLEFGDQYIRFYANNGQIVTTATTYLLTLIPTLAPSFVDPVRGTVGYIYATRPDTILQQNEALIWNQSNVPSNTILELKSPYLAADLSKIQYCQSSDTLYLFHPNYMPYKLQRQAQTEWKLSPVAFQDGPYLALNTYEEFGDFSNITVETNTSFTFPGFFGNQIRTFPFTITGAITDPGGSGQIQITTSTNHGLTTGQNVFVKGVVGTTEANNWSTVDTANPNPAYWPVVASSATTLILVGSSFTNAYASGGTVQPALFAQSAAAEKLIFLGTPTLVPDSGRLASMIIAGKRYFGYLGGNPTFIDAATGTISSKSAIPASAVATGFQLGVYSPGFGFPTCGCFHQNRLVMAGPGAAPQEVDGSVVGEFENFAPSDPSNLEVADSNAFSFQLNSSDANVISWLASTSFGLLAGTLASEWCITPDSSSSALTPTNFNAQQSSFFGAAAIPPVQIANSTIYVQRAQRKIREMSYFFAAGTFRSIEMTELSEHITVPTVTRLAVTKETQPLIWAVRSDGALISMIFNRDDLSLVAGWTRHELGGQSDTAGTQPIVSSIASIPSKDLSFDQLWMVVQRHINGSNVYYIEYMTKIFDDSILQEDAFQLDCGATFYNPGVISAITIANPSVLTFSGASFTNGDRVKITGVVGLNKKITDVNGNTSIVNLVNEQYFTVAAISGSTFQLNDMNGNPVSSIGYSAYVSGGSVAKCVTTISGITWLEGETLIVLGDGGYLGSVTVSSGSITLPQSAAKVQLGYGYVSQGQLLRIDAGSPDGTSIGKTRRSCRIALQMYRTGNMSIGTSFDNLIPLEFAQADVDQVDYPMPLFSGIIREGLESAYDFDSQPCFQVSSPFPACLQSISTFMEEFDV